MANNLQENIQYLALQYKDSNIQDLLLEIGKVGDLNLTDAFSQFPDKWNIDTATGVWLDYIGYRLGVRHRPSYALGEVEYFGFDVSGGTGFDQQPFFSEVGDKAAIGDEDYRRFLKSRAQQLLTDCTPTSIKKELVIFFDGAMDTVFVADNYNMTMTVDIETSLDANVVNACINAGLITKPAGVELITNIVYI